jgi:hypothetical protein
MPVLERSPLTYATKAPTMTVYRNVKPAGSLTDDVMAAIDARMSALAQTVTTAATAAIAPTIRDAMTQPEFAQNMGVGVVQELAKPQNAVVLQTIGSSAGASLASLPWVVAGSFLAGAAVAGAVAYFSRKR